MAHLAPHDFRPDAVYELLYLQSRFQSRRMGDPPRYGRRARLRAMSWSPPTHRRRRLRPLHHDFARSTMSGLPQPGTRTTARRLSTAISSRTIRRPRSSRRGNLKRARLRWATGLSSLAIAPPSPPPRRSSAPAQGGAREEMKLAAVPPITRRLPDRHPALRDRGAATHPLLS